MNINVIFASTKRGGIGYKNKIPWFIKDDLMHFKNITKQKGFINIIIMGKNTWNSLPNKPLKGRTNIILTRNPMDIKEYENTMKQSSLLDALNFSTRVSNTHDVNLSIIGGEYVYNEFEKFCDKINEQDIVSLRKVYSHSLYHTIIDVDYECDRFFKPNMNRYILVSKEDKNVLEENTKENVNICYLHYKSK